MHFFAIWQQDEKEGEFLLSLLFDLANLVLRDLNSRLVAVIDEAYPKISLNGRQMENNEVVQK